MNKNYKEKLRQFCIGLEIENVEDLLEKPPEFLKALGEKMTERIKELLNK